MSAARTGPAAHSIRKPTASTSIRTRPPLHCETFPPSSLPVALKPRGEFFAPPPNPEKKMARPDEAAPVEDAEQDLEGPAVRAEDSVLAEDSGAHSSASTYKACRW